MYVHELSFKVAVLQSMTLSFARWKGTSHLLWGGGWVRSEVLLLQKEGLAEKVLAILEGGPQSFEVVLL